MGFLSVLLVCLCVFIILPADTWVNLGACVACGVGAYLCALLYVASHTSEKEDLSRVKLEVLRYWSIIRGAKA